MSNQKNWKVLDGCIVTDEADPQMVLVPSFSDHQYKPEDLQLMASAPKLLAIVEQAFAAFNYLSIRATSKEDREEFARREKEARIAIAKATGQ
ncbi:hypothetical protein [Azospirillum sp. TSO5]|uniref:hypothetical protein n=1 Tax=Azospirillum sp. TSO5 TaxID=716760 RepID=UPI000D619541|nr:hypothetical protein [Azospirillum sp. TSO5]PWC98055.1 hypothetical protein TSO5_03375 [Azospirillum sp. TSO5]